MKLLQYFLVVLFTASVFVSCQKEINFDLGVPSAGTLKSSDLGDCLPSAVKGSYKVDTTLNSTNFIEVTVNITTPGTYEIKSDTINGYSFAGTGTANTVGLNTVKLQGFGVPAASGTDVFTIIYNNSSCKISVNVTEGNGVYFPLTQNSWWSYDLNIPFPGDSVLVKSDNNILINGNTYRIFQTGPDEEVADSLFYFKTGTEYYQRLDVSDFTFGVNFDEPKDTVIMFLNEGMTPATFWSSEFDGTIANQAAKIRYTYTLLSDNENLDINGHSFTTVLKVRLITEFKIGNGAYTEDSQYEFFYAPGVGLIRVRGWLATDPNNVLVQDIKNYQVL